MGCESTELVPRKRSTSWPPCVHLGFDDSQFGRNQLGNWRQRAPDTFYWMNQLDGFISFTEG